jgi:peroxiredoxin (alkyl hydroperoxide reductase subunit C)
MDDICCGLRVGDKVPDFSIDTFDPTKGAFSKFKLKDQIKKGGWTVMFFYPADFTFV